jgi:glutathionyl-hydroquinone reductase
MDRYHLYVAHGCPWPHRALIYRAVKKLENVISDAYAVLGLRERGWSFERDGTPRGEREQFLPTARGRREQLRPAL